MYLQTNLITTFIDKGEIDMSADNGVYILKTNKEYRVIQTKAIENIFDDLEEYIPEKVVEYFGKCKSTRNAEMAFKIAQKILKEVQLCEHGIKLLPFCEKSWEQITREVNNKKGELK